MWQTLVQLLPIGLAAAVSMLPIMTTIMILVSDRRDRSALPYTSGWAIGVATFAILATIGAQFLPEGRPRHRDTAVGVAEVLIGCALMLLGVVTFVRGRRSSVSQVPTWMSKVDSLDPLPAFGLGVALNIRPKALLLAAAAGLILHAASLKPEAAAVGVAFFTILATSTVVGPVVLTSMFPGPMEPRLRLARTQLAERGTIVTGVAMLMVGLLLLVLGVGTL